MTPQPNVLIIPLKVFVLNKNGESLKGLTVGTAEGTRTPNIQNRNLTLYPLNYGRILRSIFSMRSVIIAGIFQNVKGIFHFWGIFFPTGGSCPGVSQRMEEAQRAGEQTAARQPAFSTAFPVIYVVLDA